MKQTLMALRFGRLVLAAAAACTLASALSSCAADQAREAFLSQNNSFIAKTEECCRPMTQELAGLVKTDPQLKRLLEKINCRSICRQSRSADQSGADA